MEALRQSSKSYEKETADRKYTFSLSLLGLPNREEVTEKSINMAYKKKSLKVSSNTLIALISNAYSHVVSP